MRARALAACGRRRSLAALERGPRASREGPPWAFGTGQTSIVPTSYILGPEVHASVTCVGFTNGPHSLICRKATRLVSPWHATRPCAAATSDPHTPPPSRPTVSETGRRRRSNQTEHATYRTFISFTSDPFGKALFILAAAVARTAATRAIQTRGRHTTCDYYRGRHLRPPHPSSSHLRHTMRLFLRSHRATHARLTGYV
jgi:hypothetical protein